VLVQSDDVGHIAVPFVHSLMSAHVTPLPVKPVLHAQVNEPIVLVQLALGLQLAVPKPHSSMSLQVVPSPEYPLWHRHV
jgi:hypothetical protein